MYPADDLAEDPHPVGLGINGAGRVVPVLADDGEPVLRRVEREPLHHDVPGEGDDIDALSLYRPLGEEDIIPWIYIGIDHAVALYLGADDGGLVGDAACHRLRDLDALERDAVLGKVVLAVSCGYLLRDKRHGDISFRRLAVILLPAEDLPWVHVEDPGKILYPGVGDIPYLVGLILEYRLLGSAYCLAELFLSHLPAFPQPLYPVTH